MDEFHHYLLSGGMPDVVSSLFDNDFTWLMDAGIVIPVCSVDEPHYPLEVKSGKSYRRTASCRRRLKSRIMALSERLCCMRAMWKCAERWRISRCI